MSIERRRSGATKGPVGRHWWPGGYRIVSLKGMRLAFVAAAIALLGCDAASVQEPPHTQLIFRIESEVPPGGGWVYWYVSDRVLFRLTAEPGFGPVGAEVDCGTHAGIGVRLTDESEAVTLIIETVQDDGDEFEVARKSFSGAGDHQLTVLVTCP